MHAFGEIVASNALLAAALAVAVAFLGRLWRNPAALHLLWMFVLLKLVTPPLVTLPVPVPVSQVDIALEEQEALGDAPYESVPQAARERAVMDASARRHRPLVHAEVAPIQEPGASITHGIPKRHRLPWLSILA